MGVGVALYFYTVRTAMIAFLFLFLFLTPSIVITFLANPSAAEEAAEESPLAALKVFTVAALFSESGASSVNTSGGGSPGKLGCSAHVCNLGVGAPIKTDIVAAAIVWLDLLVCLILFAALPVLRRKYLRLVSKIDDDNVSAADYALLVRGVPSDVTESELKAHFNAHDARVKGGARTCQHQRMRAACRKCDKLYGVPNKCRAEQRPDDSEAVPEEGQPVQRAEEEGGGDDDYRGVADVFLARTDRTVLKIISSNIKVLEKKFELEMALESQGAAEFDQMDLDSNGSLSRSELERGLVKTGLMTPDQVP